MVIRVLILREVTSKSLIIARGYIYLVSRGNLLFFVLVVYPADGIHVERVHVGLSDAEKSHVTASQHPPRHDRNRNP